MGDAVKKATQKPKKGKLSKDIFREGFLYWTYRSQDEYILYALL